MDQVNRTSNAPDPMQATTQVRDGQVHYPEEVAAKYSFTMQATSVRLPQPYDRHVDLRTITIEEADWLYQTGLGILVLKQQEVIEDVSVELETSVGPDVIAKPVSKRRAS